MADRAKHRQNRFLTSDKIFSKCLFWFLSLKWKKMQARQRWKNMNYYVYNLLSSISASILYYTIYYYYTPIVMSKRYER